MIKICAHRGLWDKQSPQNSKAAIGKALSRSMAVEIDIHAWNGKIYVTHDGPENDSHAYLFEEIYPLFNSESVFFLDIKTKNCLPSIALQTQGLPGQIYFNNIPKSEISYYLDSNLDILDSVNKEDDLALEQKNSNLLIDIPDRQVFSRFCHNSNLDAKIEFYISLEIHQQDPQEQWELLKQRNHPNSYICTDFFERASRFFK